eukprot:Hpha_TRINITY_DN6604_c0_g1::TRINITY_DN6604_c0_g1_i2::g.26570::m.26570
MKYEVLYTRQKTQRMKRWLDGELEHNESGVLILRDAGGYVVEQSCRRGPVSAGSEIELESHLIQISSDPSAEEGPLRIPSRLTELPQPKRRRECESDAPRHRAVQEDSRAPRDEEEEKAAALLSALVGTEGDCSKPAPRAGSSGGTLQLLTTPNLTPPTLRPACRPPRRGRLHPVHVLLGQPPILAPPSQEAPAIDPSSPPKLGAEGGPAAKMTAANPARPSKLQGTQQQALGLPPPPRKRFALRKGGTRSTGLCAARTP